MGSKTLAFSGISLQGTRALEQEDALYVSATDKVFLLVDAAGAAAGLGGKLAQETLRSFTRIKETSLLYWLESWNRKVYAEQQKKNVSSRATASILAGRQRSSELWEIVILGQGALWRMGAQGVEGIHKSELATQTLGVRAECRAHSYAVSLKNGEWLLAGTGAFLGLESTGAMVQLKDFLQMEDFENVEFRNSAKRFIDGQNFQTEQNSSIVWLK